MAKQKRSGPQQGSFLDSASPAVIQHKSATDFVREAMKKYGEEVIMNRSLPRLEDGLRPVQRLLFWSCADLAATKFVKSAKITGHCIASYSPHGEKAAYDSLVRMVRERFPLAEGQGNFGSATTSAASARYTESRISPFGYKLIIGSGSMAQVPYEKNYDDTLDQPVYLPGILPTILLNSSSGVAVAITSKICGFGLAEVAAAVKAVMAGKGELAVTNALGLPEVGRCELLTSAADLRSLLQTGDGQLEFECQHRIEQKGKAKLLIVTGYAPEFSVSGFLAKCGQLQDTGGVIATRNETSEANGDRIVVEYADDETLDKLRKLLRKKVSYKFNVIVEENSQLSVKLLGVHDILKRWVEVRRSLVKRQLQAQLTELQLAHSKLLAKQRAASNRKALLAAVDDPADFVVALQKHCGLSAEDAAIVAKMPIESLRKTNLDDLSAQIAKAAAAVSAATAAVADPDAAISDQISDLLKWAKAEAPELLAKHTTAAKVAPAK